MSVGGKSLKRKDYLTIGAALAATGGLGAAGIGPMAGLFAGESAGAGAAGLLGAAAPGEAAGAFTGTSSALGYGGELASVGEAGGTMLGGAAPQNVSLAMTPGGLLGKATDAMSNYNKAMQLAKLAQGPEQPPPQAAAPPPQQQVSTDPLAGIEAIFGIKRKKERYYG